MSADRLGEVEVDRLEAAVFEQRRLSHMLRQRGVEIEALRDERERLAAKESAAREREGELRAKARELEAKFSSATAHRERLEAELATNAAERDRLEAELATAAAERERFENELKQVGYDFRRAERRVAKVEGEAAEANKRHRLRLDTLGTEMAKVEEERQRLRDELTNARQMRDRIQRELAERTKEGDRAKAELAKAATERERLETELGKARYEARRAERRVTTVEGDAAEAGRRSNFQIDALVAELREIRVARDEALKARDEASVSALESVRGLEDTARELGRARREVELLASHEKALEVRLAGLEGTLEEVADHLLRVRASRSWRWGHSLAQAFRTLTFRRRSSRSALDAALDRLEVEGRVRAVAG